MTSDAEIWNRLHQVFIDLFGDEEITLTEETTADDVDGWDSVTTVELMVGLEREFGIRFTTGEMATLKNVGQLVERIRAAT